MLSVVWNPLLRTLSIKREKVCAVCPYLLFLNWLFIVALTTRSYRDCHLLGMRNFWSSNFTAICWATSEVVHYFVDNNGFRSRETLNLYISSGIWGPSRRFSLKITNSLSSLYTFKCCFQYNNSQEKLSKIGQSFSILKKV